MAMTPQQFPAAIWRSARLSPISRQQCKLTFRSAWLAIVPAVGTIGARPQVDEQERTHGSAVADGQLEGQADPPGAGVPGPGGAGGGGAQSAQLPPAGVHQGGARPQGEAGRRGAGQGLPAAGRRLRGELQGAQDRLHPRLFPAVPADGADPDLRRQLAGGEGGARRRPVRQAALLAHREAGRQGAAELPRRHHQRAGVHGRRRAFPIRAGSSRPTASRRRP